MTRTAKPPCERCTKHDAAVLKTVHIDSEAHAGGRAYETRTHFRCRQCGAKWVQIVAGGLGGYDHSWNQET
jgi:hypothetical protein